MKNTRMQTALTVLVFATLTLLAFANIFPALPTATAANAPPTAPPAAEVLDPESVSLKD